VWVVETEEEYEPELADPALSWAAGSAVSRLDARRRLAELRAEPPREVALLPEFVATPRPVTSRTEARRRLGVTDDEFLVMAAGIGTERKAPDLFVEIALGFNARRTGARPARFVWVGGEDGELRRRVADHATSYPPLDLVTFVPTVDDLDSLLAAADVFLHPAREDAFPLVCVTAAALGVPVVAFAGVGGVPEMLGETFVGAPYPDVRGLVDHILGLADAPTAEAVGRAQQARVVARYLAPTGAPRVRAALERAALERSGLECPGAGTGSQRQGGEAPGERTASSAGG
jgi:glycosyltransferase involved in cell wall biosynthesis